MTRVSEKRKSQHCTACGHHTFVSYDGTIFRCERCHPANQGASVKQTGVMNPKMTADQVLARARRRGGSGEGDVVLIEKLIYQRGSDLDQDRIDSLKRALRIANDADRERRRA